MKFCPLKKLFPKSTLRKSKKIKGAKLQGAENPRKQVFEKRKVLGLSTAKNAPFHPFSLGIWEIFGFLNMSIH